MTNLVIDGTRDARTLEWGPRFDSVDSVRGVAEPFVVCARAVVDALPDGDGLWDALELLHGAMMAAVAAVPVVVPVLVSPAQALGYEAGANTAVGLPVGERLPVDGPAVRDSGL